MEKVFWIISILFSLGFIIQILITFLSLNNSKSEYKTGLTETPGNEIIPDLNPELPDGVNMPVANQTRYCPEFMQNFRVFHPKT